MKNKATKYYIIASVLILLDQVTKLWIKGFNILGIKHQGLSYGEIVPVISDWLQWTYIENQGMAFGITFGWGKIFLSIISLIASGCFIYYIYKISAQVSFFCGLAFTLLLSGAFGNAIDRCFYGVLYGTNSLFYGGVVDFILVDIPDITILKWSHFPVFNVADSCVTCGIILLLLFHKHIPDLETTFPKLADK